MASQLSGMSFRQYARLAGVLGLISALAGAFGEAYVPTQFLVAGDAAATARRIVEGEALFRAGFAAYLVEALCDAGLTMVFWVLLRRADRNLAMLMVVLRVIATCGFAAAQMLHLGALPTLLGAQAVAGGQPEHSQSLAFTLLVVAGVGRSLFSVFYGAGNIVLGILLYRSRLVPRALGGAMVFAGLAFVTHGFLMILSPAQATPLLLASAAIAFIPLILWLLIKGVDEEAQAAKG